MASKATRCQPSQIFRKIEPKPDTASSLWIGMRREEFLNLRRFPGRLTVEEAGWILGFSTDHVRLLLAARLLSALGHPPTNGVKYLHTQEILSIVEDSKRMAKLSDFLVNTWQARNQTARQRVRKESSAAKKDLIDRITESKAKGVES